VSELRELKYSCPLYAPDSGYRLVLPFGADDRRPHFSGQQRHSIQAHTATRRGTGSGRQSQLWYLAQLTSTGNALRDRLELPEQEVMPLPGTIFVVGLLECANSLEENAPFTNAALLLDVDVPVNELRFEGCLPRPQEDFALALQPVTTMMIQPSVKLVLFAEEINKMPTLTGACTASRSCEQLILII
jgi:hypothetical protein